MPPAADFAVAHGADAVVLRDVWKTYGTAIALRDVTLTVPSGRILGLLGPNGAGKSTVLRIAAGLSRPTRGVVEILGTPPGLDGVRRAIGFAGHRSFLYAALTAEENLRFYADLYGLPPAAVESALDRFGLGDVRHRRVGELSRGLVQRLTLARALLHDPRILLLDEPFTGLDAVIRTSVASALDGLRGAGCTVVLATHEWDAARDLADEAVVLVRGQVVLRTAPGALAPSDLPALFAARPDRGSMPG